MVVSGLHQGRIFDLALCLLLSDFLTVDRSSVACTLNFKTQSYGTLTLAPVGMAGGVVSTLVLPIGPMRRVAQTVWSR